jgi:hypothetical protein
MHIQALVSTDGIPDDNIMYDTAIIAYQDKGGVVQKFESTNTDAIACGRMHGQ